jgi:hypothetical protein
LIEPDHLEKKHRSSPPERQRESRLGSAEHEPENESERQLKTRHYFRASFCLPNRKIFSKKMLE